MRKVFRGRVLVTRDSRGWERFIRSEIAERFFEFSRGWKSESVWEGGLEKRDQGGEERQDWVLVKGMMEREIQRETKLNLFSRLGWKACD